MTLRRRRHRRLPRRPERKEEMKLLGTAAKGAASFIRFCQREKDISLSFSIDDIGFMDRLLSENFEQNNLPPDVVISMGLYLGEIMRHTLGGRYRLDKETGALCLSCEGIVAFPVAKVKRTIAEKRHRELERYLFDFARLVSERKGKSEKRNEN